MDKTNSSEVGSLACFGLKTILFERKSSVVITAIGVSIFNTILAFTATFGNGLMIFVLATKQSLKSPSNLLICSLCVTDFIVGLVVQPLHVVSRVYETRGIHLCKVKLTYAYFAFLCSGASFLNVTLISLDRYYAVCHPFLYEANVTAKKYSVAVAVMWASWSAMTLLPFVGVISTKSYNLVLFVSLIACIVTIFICYGCIYVVANRLRNAVAPPASVGSDEERKTVVKRANEQRKTNTMAILITILILCYAPNVTCGLLESVLGFSLDLAYVAWHWTGLLVFANSSFNPLLYCIRSSDIRRVVYREVNRRTGLLSQNGGSPVK